MLAVGSRPGRSRPAPSRETANPRPTPAPPVRRRVRAVSANGVLGDPTGAAADEGRRLLAAAMDDLEALVTDWMPGA